MGSAAVAVIALNAVTINSINTKILIIYPLAKAPSPLQGEGWDGGVRFEYHFCYLPHFHPHPNPPP